MWKWSLSIKQIKMITLCKLSRQKSYKLTEKFIVFLTASIWIINKQKNSIELLLKSQHTITFFRSHIVEEI